MRSEPGINAWISVPGSNSSICLHYSAQQQLNSSLDDETAAFLHDCYTLEEKERLKEEWRLFEEQKRNFARERKNFTEAAIRLGREVRHLFCSVHFLLNTSAFNFFCPPFRQKKAFQEDRATWLKNQFLSMTPFTDRRRCSSSDGQSALSISKSAHRSRVCDQRRAPVFKLGKDGRALTFQNHTGL